MLTLWLASRAEKDLEQWQPLLDWVQRPLDFVSRRVAIADF